MSSLNSSVPFAHSEHVDVVEKGADRRKSKRFPLHTRAIVSASGIQIFQGETIDISEGGLSVLIETALKVGQLCRVCFTAVAGDHVLSITGHGSVANCICTKGGFRIGLLFEGRDDDNNLLIAQLIEDRQSR